MSDTRDMEFIGYDLGHGETAIARAWARSAREPEILEHAGERSFVTAVARDKSGVRIGAGAVSLAALGNGKTEIWTKFKSRDLTDETTRLPTRLFTQALMSDLEADKKIEGKAKSRFIVGCPSGWSEGDREAYAELMRESGLTHVRIVPESRAALMTALEQGYLSLEAARARVLIVDIGSSTTDFTWCVDLKAEDVGHNVLGSGLLDTLIFDRNLARQTHRAKIEKLIAKFPWYRPILEYWCRLAKEQYFNGSGTPVETIHRLPVAGGVLFEIRIDEDDEHHILNAPIKELNGFSWPETFDYALNEAVEQLEGREPETVLLTGGASRLPLVAPACEKAFPNARVVRGAEPEFAIARGLAWLGRFEHLYTSFTTAIEALVAQDGPIRAKAEAASRQLGQLIAPVLVDALIEACVLPAFADWRRGEIKTQADIDENLNQRVRNWLASPASGQALRPVIEDWFAGFQRQIEEITDPLCREHNLPAMVLSLDDSTHIARHLEALELKAPQVTTLESDTALAGTTLSTLLISALLAQAHLLAPLLANPLVLVIGGVIGVGGFFASKTALKGKMRNSNLPKPVRMMVTEARVRRIAKRARPDMIHSIEKAWTAEAASRFAEELTQTLKKAFLERADERAVLFLL